MRKTLIVAHSEFTTLVRSKAFMVGVVLMPVFMGRLDRADPRDEGCDRHQDRTFAFVDYTGVLAEPLKAVAGLYNASTADAPAAGLARKGPRFLPVEVNSDGQSPETLRLGSLGPGTQRGAVRVRRVPGRLSWIPPLERRSATTPTIRRTSRCRTGSARP